jgi:hypothetical protein
MGKEEPKIEKHPSQMEEDLEIKTPEELEGAKKIAHVLTPEEKLQREENKDLKIKTSEELDEAKKIAGVSEHSTILGEGGVVERFFEMESKDKIDSSTEEGRKELKKIFDRLQRMMPGLEQMGEKQKNDFLEKFFWKLSERGCAFIETGVSETNARIIVDEDLRAIQQDVSHNYAVPTHYSLLSSRDTNFVLREAKDNYPKRIDRLKQELKKAEEGSKLCEILIKKQKKK